MNLRLLLLAGVATVMTAPVAVAAPQAATAARHGTAATPAGLSALVEDFRIPFQTFTLPNGLKVIVLTDRSVPLVYTAIWYEVGSTYEPAGRSGFAHLFEHLMFNGSENVPGDYFTHLRDAGIIGANGGTSNDSTMYYETVPTGSLDRVLYMESDRMGHLLGAVTQGVLDEQRGVVQNEKRNGDNSPTSILGYRKTEALYPPGHPYGHSVIGSMKDLNAASVADVHQWFKDHYGPNNATIVLAGDIDLATAKAKVTKYFGDIPRGKENVVPVAPVPVLKAPIEEKLTAPVSAAMISRTWPIPGVGGADAYALDAVSGLMGSIDGNPLNETLVRRDKLFTAIGVNPQNMRSVGEFTIRGMVREGVDPAVAARALDEVVAAFLRSTPPAADLQRWKSATIIPMIQGQEAIESRASKLITAAVFRGSAGAYKADLEAYLKLTPAQVMAAARTWLTRPAYRVTLLPGPRMTATGDESAGGPASVVPPAKPAPAATAVPPQTGTRGPLPPVGEPGSITFPAIERTTLTNGIPVTFVRAGATPFTMVAVQFPVGGVDDPAGKPELINSTFQMLGKGAAGHDDHWFAQQSELTGIDVDGGANADIASVSVTTPTASLRTALERGMLLLTRPDFPADRFEEMRRRQLSYIAAAPTNPNTLVRQVFAGELAPGSAHARMATVDTAAGVNGVTIPELKATFERWVRPRNATIFISSNEPLAALLPDLNATIGSWKTNDTAPPAPAPVRTQATRTGAPRIVLIDMPDAVQATVTGGQLLAIPYSADPLAARVANVALGDGFLSRINMNLREDKHWTYGASGDFSIDKFQSSYVVQTQIQPDKVGAGITEIRREVKDVLSDRPVTKAEFDQAIANLLRQRVGDFRIAAQVAGGARRIVDHGWPDDFFTTFGDRLHALTVDEVNAALRQQLDPSKWVWVVAGNAKVIRPQLDDLGLPVEIVTPQQVLAGK